MALMGLVACEMAAPKADVKPCGCGGIDVLMCTGNYDTLACESAMPVPEGRGLVAAASSTCNLAAIVATGVTISEK